MDFLFFNFDNGYLEGVVRGYREGILTQSQYLTLTQCENMEDLKLQLSATDYAPALQNETVSSMTTAILAARCTDQLVEQFQYLRANSSQPLSNYGYMIDNVILLITGTLRSRDVRELLDRCHPLGLFETMGALGVATNIQELYNLVLIETPLAPYFANCLSVHDLDELNIEIIRNTLYKAYLEDFHQFCLSLGGSTAIIMSEILKFEADRRAITITVNSLGTELSKDERARLYPNLGRLYPDGMQKLARADELEQVSIICESYPEYRSLFSQSMSLGNTERTLDDKFFEQEVNVNKIVFLQQFNFGVFYAYFRLKEQEIRNIVWIAECISQQQRDKINNFISVF